MLVKTTASNALKKYNSIGIVGAGIGGLTTANALLFKEDLVDRVELFDQAKHFIPTAGAGFGLSANGQICLRSIGFDANFVDTGHDFRRMVRVDSSGKLPFRVESDSLEQLRQKHGFGISGFLRADLVDLLLDRLENSYQQKVHYSHKLSKISQVHDKVELEFENGHQDVFDLVIGADGIHSTVAKQLGIDDDVPPIYANANIFYGKIPHPDKLEYFQNSELFQDNTIVNAAGVGENLQFYCGAGEKKQFLWVNTYKSDAPPQQREEWDVGNSEELSTFLSQNFPEGHFIHDLAEMTKPDDILHFGLYYRRHKKTWTNDRVTLLGDACHATLPFVGQGANQAIEDAIVLADCLAKHEKSDYTAAYDEYYKSRFPRTKRVVQIAGFLNRLYHSEYWIVKKMKDIILDNAVQGGAAFKQMEKEIVDECPIKDYRKYVVDDGHSEK